MTARATTFVTDLPIVEPPDVLKKLQRHLQKRFDLYSGVEFRVYIEAFIQNDEIGFELVARNRDNPMDIIMRLRDSTVIVMSDYWRTHLSETLREFHYIDPFGYIRELKFRLAMVIYSG